MNLTKWDEWKDTDAIYLATWFLEGILTEFIQKAKKIRGLESAVRHAEKGRALGLGVLGFHSLLQSKMLAFEDFGTNMLNKAIFKKMKEETTRASQDMANEYGKPEWCATVDQRHTHLMAMAPTASNALISGGVSPSIEPWNANVFVNKSAKGTFFHYNESLKELLVSYEKDTAEIWSQINGDSGSVRSLDFLTPQEKLVFKTAFEIDMRVIVDLAGDRQKYIDQAQSLNLFFNSNVSPQYFHDVHVQAWKRGLNTLYYCRSNSVLKADLSSRDSGDCVACEG
jgi:ribonucleoside-diphosphate reductase alpha chain